MKTRHWKLIKGFALAALLPLCAACSSEDDNLPLNEDKQPVQVNITRATMDGSGNWSWQNNDQVGLSITDNDGTDNYTMTYNGSNWTASPALQPVNLPAMAEAWYPSTATMDRFNIPYSDGEYDYDGQGNYTNGSIDQSSLDKLVAMDYMTTDAMTMSNASLDVTLRHRMCHVTITVVQNNGFTPLDVKMYSYSAVTRDVDDEYIMWAGSSLLHVNPYITENNTVYQALISPGLYSANMMYGAPLPLISMVVNGIKVKATYGQNLRSGNAYTFNLTINNPSTRSTGTSECVLELVEVEDVNK